MTPDFVLPPDAMHTRAWSGVVRAGPVPSHHRRNNMRGSSLIWTIVGVLLIIALLIYIL